MKLSDLMYDQINDQINIHHVFQPIIDITTNQVFGYEMLLRSKEIESPEQLFAYAEKQNKLFDLDILSIERAFQTINDSQSMLEGLHLFINILPSTIGNPASLSILQRIKSSLNFNINNIVFEITEERKEAELMMCKHMVGDIKNQGFLIALDDIGKGDSTLPYVIELEPNIVKLDRYFSKDLANNQKKQKLIEMIVSFLGDDTMIILEGLENDEDLLTAQALGIQLAQGYVLGKPRPLDYYLSKQ